MLVLDPMGVSRGDVSLLYCYLPQRHLILLEGYFPYGHPPGVCRAESFNRRLQAAIADNLEPHRRRTCDLVCAKAKVEGSRKSKRSETASHPCGHGPPRKQLSVRVPSFKLAKLQMFESAERPVFFRKSCIIVVSYTYPM